MSAGFSISLMVMYCVIRKIALVSSDDIFCVIFCIKNQRITILSSWHCRFPRKPHFGCRLNREKLNKYLKKSMFTGVFARTKEVRAHCANYCCVFTEKNVARIYLETFFPVA